MNTPFGSVAAVNATICCYYFLRLSDYGFVIVVEFAMLFAFFFAIPFSFFLYLFWINGSLIPGYSHVTIVRGQAFALFWRVQHFKNRANRLLSIHVLFE